MYWGHIRSILEIGIIKKWYFSKFYLTIKFSLAILIKKQPFIFFLPKKQRIYDYFYEFASEALQIVIFENFIKSITSCLWKSKVTHSFCFKIPDDPTATSEYNSSGSDILMVFTIMNITVSFGKNLLQFQRWISKECPNTTGCFNSIWHTLKSKMAN